MVPRAAKIREGHSRGLAPTYVIIWEIGRWVYHHTVPQFSCAAKIGHGQSVDWEHVQSGLMCGSRGVLWSVGLCRNSYVFLDFLEVNHGEIRVDIPGITSRTIPLPP